MTRSRGSNATSEGVREEKVPRGCFVVVWGGFGHPLGTNDLSG